MSSSSSSSSSSMSLVASPRSGPRRSANSPNSRFMKHIVEEADGHLLRLTVSFLTLAEAAILRKWNTMTYQKVTPYLKLLVDHHFYSDRLPYDMRYEDRKPVYQFIRETEENLDIVDLVCPENPDFFPQIGQFKEQIRPASEDGTRPAMFKTVTKHKFVNEDWKTHWTMHQVKLENGKQVSGYSPRLFGARLQRFMKLHCVFCHKKIHDRKRPSFSTGWRNVHFGESHICEPCSVKEKLPRRDDLECDFVAHSVLHSYPVVFAQDPEFLPSLPAHRVIAYFKNEDAARALRKRFLEEQRPRELEMLERVRQRKVEFERQMQQGRNSPHAGKSVDKAVESPDKAVPMSDVDDEEDRQPEQKRDRKDKAKPRSKTKAEREAAFAAMSESEQKADAERRAKVAQKKRIYREKIRQKKAASSSSSSSSSSSASALRSGPDEMDLSPLDQERLSFDKRIDELIRKRKQRAEQESDDSNTETDDEWGMPEPVAKKRKLDVAGTA